VTVKIKDIPIEDRPRERLINYGAEGNEKTFENSSLYIDFRV